jgi:hypothetical protein
MPRYFIPVDDNKTASVEFEGFGADPPTRVLDYWKELLFALIKQDEICAMIASQKAFRVPDENGATALIVRFHADDIVCKIKPMPLTK